MKSNHELPSDVLKHLISILGNRVSTKDVDLLSYSRDYWPITLHWMLKGKIPALARAIVWPKNTREVQEIVKGIAMRCSEVIEHIEKNSQIKIHQIIADGGLSISDEFLQAVADFSSKQILRPLYLNGSAYGAYMLANAVYFKKDIIKSWKTPPIEKTFLPRKQKMEFKENWKKKVKKLIEAS
ncbi:hypothetical protein E3E22_03005 [Thermococcus sp. MV5]|nr:hypothetical protein [Thermococcus sp. MV5]